MKTPKTVQTGHVEGIEIIYYGQMIKCKTHTKQEAKPDMLPTIKLQGYKLVKDKIIDFILIAIQSH